MTTLASESASASATTTSVVVGVITFRRPQKLARLLNSLESVQAPAPWIWNGVVIVDNDPDGSARSTVEQWTNRLPKVTYISETNTGLSVARNRAVQAARDANADWLAFIDDDEEASVQWLTELAGTQRATNADAVLGNTQFLFEESPPAWLEGSRVYEFRPDVPDQQPIHHLATNNVLLRTALVEELGPLFDERFSKTGGEDHHLGRRLLRAGYTIAQSTMGQTIEWVPPDRMPLAVVLRRLQRDGNTLTIVDLSFASSPLEGIRVRLRHLAEGLAKLPLGVARAVVYGIQDGRSGILRGLKTSVIGFGQLKAVIGMDVLGYHQPDSDAI
ncbi:MAG: glycosyltransferase family 2 protein [Acidimicrobiales bacterium]|nr:glycosyltransferase family 2 protein [Acidimicrobiales bacterium]